MSVQERRFEFRSIAVIGTQSPERSLAMARLLDECIEKHGWSERIRVDVAGLGAGAGEADAAELDGVRCTGDDVTVSACPDVEQNPDLVGAAECLVVGSETLGCAMPCRLFTLDAGPVSLRPRPGFRQRT